AVAYEAVLATLNDTPERRQSMAEAAHRMALQFAPQKAAESFLAILDAWKDPAETKPAAPVETLPSSTREDLAHILGRRANARVVIFPPSTAWGSGSASNRPKQWARALAAHGCLIFYCDPQHLETFTEVEPGIVVANVPLEAFG